MTENEYIKANNELLEKWKAQNPNKAFAKDGIINTKKWFSQTSGEKILFLLKEAYDTTGAPVVWSLCKYLNGEYCCENGCSLDGKKKDSCLRSKDGYCVDFSFKSTCDNVAKWTYAINEINKKRNPCYQDALTQEEKKEILKTIAVINIKKASGVNRSNDDELYYQTFMYREYLIKQIKLIKPKVIVCGGTYGMLRCLFLKLNDLCDTDNGIRNGYALLKNEDGLDSVKIIASTHPRYIREQDKAYNNIIENYRMVTTLYEKSIDNASTKRNLSN